MKKIFTHENRMIVYNIRNLLAGEGIETRVVNEYAAGGAGDLPTFDTWPELWLEDDSQFERAQGILAEIEDDDARQAWFCRVCAEPNDAAFSLCWNCGRACDDEDS